MARTTPVNAGYTIINGSTSGSNGYRTDTWIEYKVVSQSVTNNTSTVHAFLYSAATFSSTTQYTTPAEYGYVGYDNGNKQYLSTAYDFRNYRVNKFAEYTYTIAHNSDGKKSITLQGAWNTSHSSYISGGNVSGVVNLPQIARASTIGNVSGNFGARVSIPINRQDASFTHTIEYAFGTLSGTIATQTADASVNWIVPASLISQIPNAKNGVGVVTIRTYSGGAQIGTSSASLLLSIASTTLAPVSVQAGVQTTLIATNSAGNELTYNYRYVFGDTESTISGNTSSTTYTFPIELIAQFSGVSGNGTLYVDTYNNDVFINTATASLTITLPLITAANVTATMGMQTSIALTRVYAPLTATVTATVSGNTYTLATQTTDSTIYWTPNASIADSVPNANNAVGTVTVTTYHAGVVAGSNQYNLILIVPTGNPTVSTTLTYVNSNSTIDGWNELVQGYSALQIDATASALYGSTISFLSMQGDGLGATSSPNTSPASISGVSSVFATDGTFTYTSNATDGRGRSTSVSDIVTVYPYAKPTLTNVSIYRANSSGVADPAGTELGMTFTSGYSSVNGKNSATVYLEYRLAEDNTYNTYGAVTSGDVTSLPIRVDKNYVTRLRIVDGLNTVYSAAVNIPTAERVMNVNASGKGLAIGKMSQKNALEIAWATEFAEVPTAAGKQLVLAGQAENNFLVSDGLGSMVEKTPSEVLSIIGAAPAVYEYKGVNGVDCNSYTTDTKIFVMNGVNDPNADSHGFLDVKRYDGVGFVPFADLGDTNPVVHQKFTQFQNYWTAHRWSIDGGATWSEWEYDNPPMVAGVEYRTTERCNGRPIFKKLIAYNVASQIGSTSTIVTHSIPHGISGFAQAIRAETWKGNYIFPMFATNGGTTNVAQVDATNIYLRFINDYVGTGNMYISLAYLKTGIY